MRARPVRERRRPAGLDLLPEPVREQHRTLRVTLGRGEERVQRLADAAAGLAEARGHVRGDVGVGQTPESHRHGGAVERSLLVLEELAHQPGSEPAKTNDATSPWNWMWLRSSASISFTFVMSWNSSSTISAR